ncbi:ChaC-like protein-domain-containing protein [Lophiotrema nucula]|uniref:glutathione-specific gamma-glutamylcyclotransferase n=1 Tax=Lophiotrema nucula TaxID=690887 RepID=A0A6A5ZG13_9PLEO|nr:ChaC-like protein-domain-containing protein [Lophiotrema nucula]
MGPANRVTSSEEHSREIAEFGQHNDFWLFGYGSLIWKPPPHYDQRVPGYIEGYVRRFWQASEDHRGTPEAPGRVATLIDKAHWETLTDHHASTERVWGAAYHIESSKVAEVREYLDIREINGYSIQFTPFHPAPFTTSISSPPTSPSFPPSNPPLSSISLGHRSSNSITAETVISSNLEPVTGPIRCLVYIGLPENPQFMGPQDPDELARHILRSKGPSGENKEYLYLLERSLLELSKDSGDAHVSDLVRRARKFEIEARGEVVDVGIEGGEGGGDAGYGEVEDGKVEVKKGADADGEPLHKVGSTEEQEEVEK